MQRGEHVLVDVLGVVAVSHVATDAGHDDWPEIVQQRTIGIAITPLRVGHQPRAPTLLVRVPRLDVALEGPIVTGSLPCRSIPGRDHRATPGRMPPDVDARVNGVLVST